MRYNHEKDFWENWPSCVDSIQDLYENQLILPDYRYEFIHDHLRSLRQNTSINEIDKVLRQLWNFDDRFFGEVTPFTEDDYAWATYSVVYLGKNKQAIQDLLTIFPLLLGQFLKQALGANIHTKIGATFMDDVGHLLWDVEQMVEPEDHGLFDWHGNRNQLSVEEINSLLQKAELLPLLNPDFPPRKVLLYFTNLQDPFDSDADYQHGLEEFYRDKGYFTT